MRADLSLLDGVERGSISERLLLEALFDGGLACFCDGLPPGESDSVLAEELYINAEVLGVGSRGSPGEETTEVDSVGDEVELVELEVGLLDFDSLYEGGERSRRVVVSVGIGVVGLGSSSLLGFGRRDWEFGSLPNGGGSCESAVNIERRQCSSMEEGGKAERTIVSPPRRLEPGLRGS